MNTNMVTRMTLRRSSYTWAVGVVATAGSLACRPSDVLTVPPPAGVTSSAAYRSQTGAEGLLTTGTTQIFQTFAGGMTGANNGLLAWSCQLADELSYTYFSSSAAHANIDARFTAGGGGFTESADLPLQILLQGRLTLLSAIPLLEAYEPASGQAKVGQAFALVGYAELLAAEDYCAGAPFDVLGSAKGIKYGVPLSTDSTLGLAEAAFDSAVAHAAGDATTAAFAAVGLGRTRLARGHFTDAAAAVGTVPTSFVYNTQLQAGGFSSGAPYLYNLYDDQAQSQGCGYVNVVDRKGGNGLPYISAQDPRLVLSTTIAETCDGHNAGAPDSVWYYPVKFGNPSTTVPLATGIEARLIEAEAALHANNPNLWAADLNALRADSAETHVTFGAGQVPIALDSTTAASGTAQVDFMFRERAFWLFGTGTRLGDMRRLIRQYGRDQSTVFPVGPYPNANQPNLPSPLPNYGTDVDFTLPTPASGFTTPNPNYKGCLTSTKVA